MVIKYGKIGNILSTIAFKDRMDVIRKQEIVNPDGSLGSQVLDSFLVNEPCLVNETTKDSPKDRTLDVTRQQTLLSVYCSPRSGIRMGDVLSISVLDDDGSVLKKIEAVCNNPTFYPDHMEIRLMDWKVSL